MTTFLYRSLKLHPRLNVIFHFYQRDLVSTAKLFVDDASILSIVKNTNSSTKDFDDLLVKISNWELQ